MSLLRDAELAELDERFGPGRPRKVSIGTTRDGYEYWYRKLIGKGNRGEVTLVVQRPDGQVLLHTKTFYPAGVFRLLTGGIHAGEPVLSGATREAHEETGLLISVERFLGWVDFEFRCEDRRIRYTSYVLLMRTGDQAPIPPDDAELISGFRYAPPEELSRVAEQLRSLPPDWASWGLFRAPAHEMVADALRSPKQEG
jgi:ADP-ribose pyrophosphatase YjhB (NUDIX family)